MIRNAFINIVLFFFALLIVEVSQAQYIALQSVNSIGTTMSQKTGSISFSVGDLEVLSYSDIAGNTLCGGFINSFVISVTALSTPDNELINLNVYPNPTTGLLKIQINHTTLQAFYIMITDMRGREVYKAQFAGISNVLGINFAGYSSGVYLLTLKSKNNQLVASYKIIKN